MSEASNYLYNIKLSYTNSRSGRRIGYGQVKGYDEWANPKGASMLVKLDLEIAHPEATDITIESVEIYKLESIWP